MTRREPTRRHAGRPVKNYGKPPPPERVTIRCPKCGKPNAVTIDAAIYTELKKAIAVCAHCRAPITSP